jgi:predicted metal-dependent hydrolase
MMVVATERPPLTVRRPVLSFGDRRRTWTPAAPPLGAVADSVSLAMPFAEPYVVRSIRAVLDRLDATDPALAARARDYAAQESAHHALHRRYNDTLRSTGRGVEPLERALGWTFDRLAGRSVEFGVAFAAGFEAVAFAAARWLDPRVERFFAGADEAPAALFLWHLAEEAEHKGVAHDVLVATGVRRRTYAAGLVVSLAVLACFTWLGSLVFLTRQRRILSPVTWLRILLWTFGFLFVALPRCALSLRRDHDPYRLADPTSLAWWLGRFDPATGALPDWDDVG